MENQEINNDGIEKKKHTRRPALNFKELCIPVGGKLTYAPDPSITVEVCSERKVLHKNDAYTLSAITPIFLGVSYGICPTEYWLYNGMNLQDICNERYPNKNTRKTKTKYSGILPTKE